MILKQEYRNSGDYLFDSDSFDYESEVQNSGINQQLDSKSNGPQLSRTQSGSSSKGFFKAISALTHTDLSPKKQSSAHRARLDRSEYSQSNVVHTKSFFEPIRDSSRVRSMSPDRMSIGSLRSARSSSSLSISRTHSNTLSKLGIAKSALKKTSDSPFIDSDEDWDDSLDEDFKAARNLDKDGNELDSRLEALSINEPKEKIECFEGDENYPFLKKNYQEIMKDPFSILSIQKPSHEEVIKYNKIVKELTKSIFELSDLKKQTWGGIPSSLRALVWPILVGYFPMNKSTRSSVIDRKRKEYTNSITRLFRSEKDQNIWHQIKIDVLRTNPSIKLYSFEATHRSLERILYLWTIRHPASGYVQGINDLVTPFFHVFLSQYLTSDININEFDPKCLPKELLNIIEADTYWCFTKVLDTIQDNFIHEQPGIIRQITELKNLIKRDEPQLSKHFETENLDFIQFAFRWMNCMLMREFKLNLIIRMWDTYLSDFPIGFSQFHIYVCCAFLRRFSSHLMEMEFQDIIMFLQDPIKTEDWTEDDIEMMLSEAYVWQSLYENASAHLK